MKKQPLVSVIIPNYNAADFIVDCIDSVLNQTYENVELIIVDDGSTDNSWDLISQRAKSIKNMQIYKQNNMGAPIARNKGIDVSKGEYLLFLDSDDILFEKSIEILVREIQNKNSDMVIGNYVQIDSSGKVIKKCEIHTKNIELSAMDCVLMVPNPTNKLYKASLIKENDVRFANVRIGQDLNFFLKYLLSCKRVSCVVDDIYGWRVVSNSISNTYSFKIFDITESFKEVKKYYIKNDALELYEQYITAAEYKHYYFQMEKQVEFSDKKARAIIFEFFCYHIDHLRMGIIKNSDSIKNEKRNYKIKKSLKLIYLSSMYKKVKCLIH